MIKILKQSAKTIVCLALCVCLIFGYSYKAPAHATGMVTYIAGFVLASVCLSALGVTVSASLGDKESREFLGKIGTGIEKTFKDGAYGVADISKNIIKVTPELLQYVGDTAKELWAQGSSAFSTDESTKYIPTYFKNRGVINGFANVWDIENLFKIPARIDLVYKTGGVTSFIDFRVEKQFFPKQLFSMPLTSDGRVTYDVHDNANNPGYFNCWIGSFIFFDKYPAFLVSYSVKDQRVYGLMSQDSCDSTKYNLTNFDYDLWKYVIDNHTAVIYPQDISKAFFYDGKSIGLNDTKDVVGAIKDKCGVADDKTGGVVIPLVNTGSNTDLDARTRTQTQAQTLGRDIATEADKAAVDTANVGRDMSLPKPFDLPDLALPELIFKEKFPFCLPWDFYNSFRNLAAPAVPPKFEYPIVLSRLGINEKITLDFAPYDKLAAISRWAISLIFLVCLILQTRKLIGGD